MKKIRLFFLAWISGSLAFASITLDEAIKKGIEKNRQVKNLAIGEKIASLEVDQAKTQRWFNINASGSYLFQSEQMQIVIPEKIIAPGFIMPSQVMDVGNRQQIDVKVSLLQPIFHGNMISTLIKVKMDEKILKECQYQLMVLEITGQIKETYYKYRMLLQQRESLLSMAQRLQLHHQRLTRLFQEQWAKKSDLLETESSLEELRLSLEDINGALGEQKIIFKQLCDLDLDELAADQQEGVPTIEMAVADMILSSPLVKSLDQQIRLCQEKKRMALGRYLPQIDGFAELHYGKPGIDIFANQWSFFFQGGVRFQLPLFNWNQRRREGEIFNHTIDQLKNQRLDVIDEGKKQLEQLYQQLEVNEKKKAGIERLIEIAMAEGHLKERLLLEKQIGNLEYLACLTKEKLYQSMAKETEMKIQIIKTFIHRIIGKKEVAKTF